MGDDWQIGKSLGESISYAFQRGLWSDLIINVSSDSSQDGSKIKDKATNYELQAHSFILKSRSPVFEAMLSGKYAEKSGNVSIQHTNPSFFKIMLRYMYTDKAKLSLDNVLGVKNLARMYMLPGLEDLCMKFLGGADSPLEVDNVLDVLEQAMSLCDDDVVDECLMFCGGRHAKDILSSDRFLHLSHDALLRLVQYDRLVDVEPELLKACISWGSKQLELKEQQPVVDTQKANIRDILGDIIHNVRFLHISTEDFVELVDEASNLLTSDEKNSILYSSLNPKRIESLSRFGFNTKSRILPYSRDIDDSWTDPELSEFHIKRGGRDEGINIIVERDMLFHGVGILGADDKGYKQEVTLTIQEDDYGLGSVEKSFRTKDPQSMHGIYLKDPVKLEAKKEYLVSIDDMVGSRKYFFRSVDGNVFTCKSKFGNLKNKATGVEVPTWWGAADMWSEANRNGCFTKSHELCYIHTLYLQACM